MSYPTDQLPDISSLGGEWTLATVPEVAFGHPVQVGRAMFPDHEWPYEPAKCTWDQGTWYLDGTLLICMGCGTDGT
ncbi:hypothetical protein OG225_43290 (plasmid) [Nocardia sp. NBC_01377]|uniref:hypothetical protein n=1 Tax=Nocardia sp. NBC_01377 TaxID=2903595 RepID=UPI002F91AA11